MIQLLARRLIPNHNNITDSAVRRSYGFLCGVTGIVLNILLFSFKLFAGLISSSVAITGDAVNNLSDAASSLVTLMGFKLADQKPDRDHPFGHGRMEYISGLVVSMVILLMGFELAKSSVQKILHPEMVEFHPMVPVVLAASILVKFYMASYNRAVGKRINSSAMLATAADSLSDCLATTAALLSVIAGHLWSVSIDGWCGIVVACFILWAGINAAKETIDPLLGQPPSPEFVSEVEQLVLSHEGITGIHDLIVHDYGPGRRFISLHAEVSADGDLCALHDVIDTAEHELCDRMGCLATIHMDPLEQNDTLTSQTRERVATIVRLIDPSITIHDFRMVSGPSHTNVIFDAMVPHSCPLADREISRRIVEGVSALDGNYFAIVKIEKSFI
ncbi:MAG: cation transporter [Oscillospiraceae bacterium]|nr:cation transporter [Oscillospiraceae bacterium]